MCSEYSGWSNYPTWNVKLWIDNDQGLLEMAMEAAMNYPTSAVRVGDAVKEMLEEITEGSTPESGFQADIWQWAWEQIDWREIGQSLIDDMDEQTDDDSDDEEDTDDEE